MVCRDLIQLDFCGEFVCVIKLELFIVEISLIMTFLLGLLKISDFSNNNPYWQLCSNLVPYKMAIM